MAPDRTWSVPGYVVEELIDSDDARQVWRGRSVDGGAVALQRLPSAAPEVVARLRSELEVLAVESHPHLLRVREVLATAAETVLVVDHAPGGSLAALLRRRGRLRPGEVVTVLVPVAGALAWIHADGLGHEAVTAGNVLFTADGRPLLARPGLAVAPDGGGGGGPAEDVRALASIAVHALTGRPPGAADPVPDLRRLAPSTPEALAGVLERALSADPADRLSAVAFAAEVRRACPPEPVRLAPSDSDRTGQPATRSVRAPGHPAGLAGERAAREATGSVAAAGRTAGAEWGADAEALGAGISSSAAPVDVMVRRPAAQGRSSPRHRRRRPSRRARLAGVWRRRSLRLAVGLLAVILLGGAGVTWTRASSAAEGGARSHHVPPSGALGAPPSETARWLRVLDGLDAVRSTAYEHGDPELLTRVWAPGERLRIDTDQLRDLLRSGCTAQGVRHRFGELTLLSATGRRVRLRVVQWLPAPRRLLGGDVAGRLPGSAPAEVTVDLLATDEGWRLA